VLVVIRELFATLLVALVAQGPSLHSFDQHAVRKFGSDLQRGEDRERVRRILFTPQYRQFEFANHTMAKLMARSEQHVAEDELDDG
jgi:hypothetical protein